LPDTTNANIAFTVREIDAEVPVVVTATSEPAAAVLKLAGASEVIELGHMLGKAMAQRVLGNSDSHVVGAIDDLLIAEASMANTPLVGQTLGELAVRDRCGVSWASWSAASSAPGTRTSPSRRARSWSWPATPSCSSGTTPGTARHAWSRPRSLSSAPVVWASPPPRCWDRPA
jgi:hypothetical protein